MFLQNANLKAGHTIRITFNGGAQRDHVQGPLCLVWIFFFSHLQQKISHVLKVTARKDAETAVGHVGW